MEELKVYSVIKAMVPVYDALFNKPSLKRFVGYEFVSNVGKAGGWRLIEEPVVISTNNPEFYYEYLQALKLGDLLPADENTAKIAGVKFNKKNKE